MRIINSLRRSLGSPPPVPTPPQLEPRSGTVAVFLGPYRNLTTITASALAFHPAIQVLNHGLGKVLDDPWTDFISHPDDDTLDRFRAAAIEASTARVRGDAGGSILASHAFADNPDLARRYHERYGDHAIKPHVGCLVWKESLRVTHRLRKGGRFDGVVSALPRLRFLLPIRNVLDCAASNLKTGHNKTFGRFNRPTTMGDMIDAIVSTHAWAMERERAHPAAVFSFTDDEVGPDLHRRLARFLAVEEDAAWLATLADIFVLRRSEYPHQPEHVAALRASVDRHCRDPDHARRLLRGAGLTAD